MNSTEAQAIIDKHLISDETGHCTECRIPGPCERRRAAADTLSAAKRLPRRQAVIPRRSI